MTSEDFFEKVQQQFNENLPFAIYRKPNESILKGFFQKDAKCHFIEDYTESGFVFSPFDAHQNSILMPVSECEILTSNFTEVKYDLSVMNIPVPNNPDKDDRKNHLFLVQNGLDAIKKNQFKKVVLSRCEHVAIEDSNPLNIFKNLLNIYSTAFVYCWFHPKIGLWLGATPETLVKIEGNRLTTMSLAGTQKFNVTLDVVWEEKELQEQQFVTDFIVKSLQPLNENIQISETSTVKAGNLLHLKTAITANYKPGTLNLKQMLHNLHPTPAVCGLPKAEAKEFILANETYNREFYTGFLGELNFKERISRNPNRQNVENDVYASIKSSTNLYVNLRCMQIKDNQVIIYVGGGITNGSIPEKEWEETVSKSEVIKSIL